jgi:hypothetical protein
MFKGAQFGFFEEPRSKSRIKISGTPPLLRGLA